MNGKHHEERLMGGMEMKKLALFLALILLFGALPVQAAGAMQASTPLSASTRARLANVRLAAEAIDGTRVGYGESFSFNESVGPRTSRYGYQSAINGRGVKVIGGGVAQVASTIYLALKKLGSGIEYTEKKTYGSSYNGKYVDSSRDAILVDYEDTDFSFINNYGGFDMGLWIEGNRLYCELTLQGNGRALSSSRLTIDGNRATRTNVTLAAGSIYETLLYPDDVFSFNDIVGPRMAKNGYKNALNGRGVNVTGGGVAQVASAVWLAVKNLDCITITAKKTYGTKYNQVYVEKSDDAILTDYNAQIDFQFKYVGDGVLSVYTQVDGDEITCDVYESDDF